MDDTRASLRAAGAALPLSTSSRENAATLRVQLVYYQSAIQLNYYKRGLFPVLEMDNMNRLSASVVLSFPTHCEAQDTPSVEKVEVSFMTWSATPVVTSTTATTHACELLRPVIGRPRMVLRDVMKDIKPLPACSGSVWKLPQQLAVRIYFVGLTEPVTHVVKKPLYVRCKIVRNTTFVWLKPTDPQFKASVSSWAPDLARTRLNYLLRFAPPDVCAAFEQMKRASSLPVTDPDAASVLPADGTDAGMNEVSCEPADGAVDDKLPTQCVDVKPHSHPDGPPSPTMMVELGGGCELKVETAAYGSGWPGTFVSSLTPQLLCDAHPDGVATLNNFSSPRRGFGGGQPIVRPLPLPYSPTLSRAGSTVASMCSEPHDSDETESLGPLSGVSTFERSNSVCSTTSHVSFTLDPSALNMEGAYNLPPYFHSSV